MMRIRNQSRSIALVYEALAGNVRIQKLFTYLHKTNMNAIEKSFAQELGLRLHCYRHDAYQKARRSKIIKGSRTCRSAERYLV